MKLDKLKGSEDAEKQASEKRFKAITDPLNSLAKRQKEGKKYNKLHLENIWQTWDGNTNFCEYYMTQPLMEIVIHKMLPVSRQSEEDMSNYKDMVITFQKNNDISKVWKDLVWSSTKKAIVAGS